MRVLSLLVAAVVLSACAPDPSPSATPQGSLSASEPSMTASPLAASPSDPVLPSVTPTSSPSATTAPTAKPSGSARLAWTKLGTIGTGAGGSVEGVRKLGDGYLAWGTHGKRDDDPCSRRGSRRTAHVDADGTCPIDRPLPDVDGTIRVRGRVRAGHGRPHARLRRDEAHRRG